MSRFTLVAVVVAIVVFSQLLHRLLRLRKFPSAPGNKYGILTHFWYLWKIWEGKFEVWDIEQHATHGKVIRVTPEMYSIDDPEAVKLIYAISSPWMKNDWYRAFGDPRDPHHNLFSVQDTQVHAAMRRKVASLYSMTTIKSYEPYINNCIAILLRQFDAYAADNRTVDMQNWMQCYAFDVIGEVTFGQRIGFLESGGRDIDGIMKDIRKATGFSALVGLDYRMLPLILAIYGNPGTGIINYTTKLLQARDNIADEKKLQRNAAEPFCTKIEFLRRKDSRYFERHLTTTHLATNIAAGSDTTSISLTSILFHLFRNREVLAKLRQEILDAVSKGKVNDPITFDQAQSLPYLQMVLKEGMRLHPATGLPMWRVVPSPGQTISGTFFPEGAIVGINAWVAHNNTTVFGKDASTFRPERWDPRQSSPEQLTQMERYYMPFGLGTRTCIGKNISILEISKLIPELVRRYDFELTSEQLEYENRWFVKPYDLQARIRWRAIA